jgi:hypothetical protein
MWTVYGLSIGDVWVYGPNGTGLALGTLPLPLPLNLTNGTGLALGLAQLVLKVLYPSFEVRVRKDSPSDDDGASDTGSDAVLLASCA